MKQLFFSPPKWLGHHICLVLLNQAFELKHTYFHKIYRAKCGRLKGHHYLRLETRCCTALLFNFPYLLHWLQILRRRLNPWFLIGGRLFSSRSSSSRSISVRYLCFRESNFSLMISPFSFLFPFFFSFPPPFPLLRLCYVSIVNNRTNMVRTPQDILGEAELKFLLARIHSHSDTYPSHSCDNYLPSSFFLVCRYNQIISFLASQLAFRPALHIRSVVWRGFCWCLRPLLLQSLHSERYWVIIPRIKIYLFINIDWPKSISSLSHFCSRIESPNFWLRPSFCSLLLLGRARWRSFFHTRAKCKESTNQTRSSFMPQQQQQQQQQRTSKPG